MNLPSTAQAAAVGRIYERFEPVPPPFERGTFKRAWCGLIEVTATHADPDALAAYLGTIPGDREAFAYVLRAMVAAGLLKGTVDRLQRDAWACDPEVVVIDPAMRLVRFRAEVEIMQDDAPESTRDELLAGFAAMEAAARVQVHTPLGVPEALLGGSVNRATAEMQYRQLGLFGGGA